MLTLPLDTLGWIVRRAHAFDGKDMDTAETDADAGDAFGVLEDRPDDPAGAELVSWINDLNDRQKAELVALFWLGRHGGDASDFQEFLEEAEGQQGRRTARYLLGSPHLGDHLESGLEALGISIGEIEAAMD